MLTIRYSVCSVVLFVMLTVAMTSAVAMDGPDKSPEKEQEHLAVLRSDSTDAAKAIACKNLAIYGSNDSVAELAKLLPHPKLSSWARIALEAIPGEASDEALRNAAVTLRDSLQYRLLVGTINSIGFRRDANAVDLLTAQLKETEFPASEDGGASPADVRSAAAVALGHIGNSDATTSLRAALAIDDATVRSAVAEGCVLCAERLLAAEDAKAAADIYDEVRASELPLQRIVEATRGAILARGQDGIPLLLEQFESENKVMFQLALGTAREFPGGDIDKVLVAEMSRVTPVRAALMIQAMADRPNTVVVPAILEAAQQGDKSVRLSALDALQRVGDDSCLTTLLKIAVEKDSELAQSAQETLAVLPGQNVNAEIVGLLPTATGRTYPLLLQLVGQRRINAVSEVLPALEHSDKTVRAAALTALGETVSLDRLSVLVSQVVAPEYPEDSAAAQLALKTASVRMPDREACAAELTAALKSSPAKARTTLLEILSDVGGDTALQTLAASAKSSDSEMQDTSSRLLGKWNSVAAAPVLLDLAKTGPAEKYQVRALRGYIGLARKFAMPEPERVAMCRRAFNATRRPAERKLVLDVLKIHPSAAGLKLAIEIIQIPEFKDAATEATLVIAQKVGGKGVDVKALLAGVGLAAVELEIVKAEYGAGTKQKDVTEAIRNQAGNLPLITLASNSYNSSFGGDPAPGVAKQLKVQYRINGKAGQASFAEDALIILPMPK